MHSVSSFGRLLQRRRKELDLTQEALAQQVGCSVVTIRRFETNQRRPSRDTAEKLAEFLQLAPEECALFLQTARGRVECDKSFPAIPPAYPHRHAANDHAAALPVSLTALIGREQEIKILRDLLVCGHVRLLTLLGPPGVGKTRLGVQAATEVIDAFDDGVFFVPLAHPRDSDLVIPLIMESLGLSEARDPASLTSLTTALHDKRLLILLDSCESVVAAAPMLIDLLARCPKVKIMVTSRTTLRVRGEQVFPVLPLALPAQTHGLTVDLALQSPAIALFVNHAQTVNPDFALSTDNVDAIAAICKHLDGLPLAVELAALRSAAIPPHVLLDELLKPHQFFQLLAHGPRDLPVRQQMLHTAIDWSYHLLDKDERLLFRRLGVFVGGGTLEAIEAICGSVKPEAESRACPMLGPISSAGTLDRLAFLINNSLVVQRSSIQGEARFMMLETVQHFAWEQLCTAGEANAIENRHIAYYLAFAESAEHQLLTGEQELWLNRLEGEHANVRAAFQRSFQKRELETSLRIGGAIWRFWYVRGYLSEGRQWLEPALADSDSVSSAVRAKSFWGAGVLALAQSDYLQAESYLKQSLTLQQERDDTNGIAHASANLGVACYWQGRYRQALVWLEQSIELFRESKDIYGQARALRYMALTLMNMQEHQRATVLLNQSLILCQEHENVLEIGRIINFQGRAALFQEDTVRAAALLERSLALFQQMGDQQSTARSLAYLGRVALAQGDDRGAAQLLIQSTKLFYTVGDKEGLATTLEGLAGVAVAQHCVTKAAQLWSIADGLRDTIGAQRPPADHSYYERLMGALCTQFAGTTCATMQVTVRPLPLDQVLAYALHDGPWGSQSINDWPS